MLVIFALFETLRHLHKQEIELLPCDSTPCYLCQFFIDLHWGGMFGQLLNSIFFHGQTDRQTDRQTDIWTYRSSLPELKNPEKKTFNILFCLSKYLHPSSSAEDLSMLVVFSPTKIPPNPPIPNLPPLTLSSMKQQN